MSLECFTGNQKTVVSVDFDRGSTCLQHCSYCYVDNMERIYPSYLAKITRNSETVKADPVDFAERLNKEYGKARNSKAKQYERLNKLPVRIYGSGDFIPEHLAFLQNADFKFFIISKNLTTDGLRDYIDELLKIDNLTSIQLSFDMANIGNYEKVKHLYGQDRIGFSFTGLSDDLTRLKEEGYQFNVYFNIAKRKAEYEKARLHREACPADAGKLKLQKACTHCNRCWRSSVTSSSNWNTFQA